MMPPVPYPDRPRVLAGPALLAHLDDGPGLAAHRARSGPAPTTDVASLAAAAERVTLLGRGGAGFPFVRKLRTAAAARGRPTVVVNLSEGEPASAKDAALASLRPHLVLDGAVATARALGAREVHVVLPGERPTVARRMRSAVAERSDRVHVHQAEPRFVAGESSAVLQLLAGRPNLPVTSWAPAAVTGHRGRPTLLSNAETWAHVALLLRGTEAYRSRGTVAEPGTTLLTLGSGVGEPTVCEVEYGVRLRDALPPALWGRPLLLGGFHGTWLPWESAASARVSVAGLRLIGAPLGAGVVFGPAGCPVDTTARIVAWLAEQSAGRCGPCFNGLPALAEAVGAVAQGRGGTERVDHLAAVVSRRGACSHPDGTVRLVRSLLAAFPAEVRADGLGRCRFPDRVAARAVAS